MKSIGTNSRHKFAALLILVVALLGLATSQVNALESIFGKSASPLAPEEAFKLSMDGISTGDDGEQIQIRFDIADGYYLYQKKFSFTASSTDITLGDPDYPEALVIEDEYFGKSNIFRDTVEINLPAAASRSSEFELTVGYQGCADIGLCYPPHTTALKVSLPKAQIVLAQADSPIKFDALPKLKNTAPITLDNIQAPANTSQAKVPGQVDINDLFNKPSSFSDQADAPLLSPEEAFVPFIESAANGEIVVRWAIESGYYMYRDKFYFGLVDAGNATVANFDMDKGKMQHDEFFGDVEVLREATSARIKMADANAVKSATLEIQSQGCADIGVCFPPQVTTIPVRFANTAALATASNDATPISAVASGDSSERINSPVAETVTDGAAQAQTATNTSSANLTTTGSATEAVALPETEQNKLSRLLAGGNLGLIALAFYVAGLLLAFTACMYPMIPILSSLIVGQGASIGATKAFGLSLVYVLSMASVFAVAGILVGLSGYNIQPLFQNPWVLSAFAALFILLALSMFGLFQLQMPSRVQTKMSEISNKQKSGSWSGVAIMGMLSALIVGPCVTPPLVAALAYIANTGDATIGGIALFAIGIGMGTPLLFIGTSLGRFMPKAGGWMETTQRIFGVVLIAVAIYMVSRFLPANVIMIMSAVLAIFTGVFFGATDRLDNDSRTTQRLGKSLSLVALIYGLVLMVGALAGSTSLLSPLKGIVGTQGAVSGSNAEDAHLVFQRIKTTDDLNTVLAQAKAEGRPVMFDFYADWCISCKEMEAFTFPDKRVKEALAGAILIQADVTKNDEADKAMLKKFGLFGPPAIILYDKNGTELEAGRVVGYMNAEKFSAHLMAYLN